MNPDVLLNRIRLEQRGLIDIHKKLYEMEHLLPIPDPMQFAKTAESAALLSEKSTAHRERCSHRCRRADSVLLSAGPAASVPIFLCLGVAANERSHPLL